MSLFAPLFLLLAFSFTSVSQAANANKGKALAKTCAACHGKNGNSTSSAFPKIAGQHASYLLKQLQDFKTKKRNNALMAGIVAPLTQENMADLSAYFAKQTSTPNVAKKDNDMIALGEKLYRGGRLSGGIPACSACHSPKGEGIASAKFPALSAQHPAYTASQLKAFRQFSLNQQLSDSKKAARENDLNKMMRDIAAELTDIEINALAQYIAGLH